MEKSYCTAIVLAAGKGKRMKTEVRKQYLMLAGKPILYYSLNVFQRSDIIDEIVLVVGDGEIDYCRYCDISSGIAFRFCGFLYLCEPGRL